MDIKAIDIAEFDYPLPDERIAKHPLSDRAACKLLVRDADGSMHEHRFAELPGLLPEDSLLVYNNTRVINARLRFRKASGAAIEVFCLEPVAPGDYAMSFASNEHCVWMCFVGNSKRWKSGLLEMPLTIAGEQVVLTAERVSKNDNGSEVRFAWDNANVSFSQIIEAAGEIPIPPYLNRGTEDSDRSDYQTVFNKVEGSVAAPTAGLHFTPEVLNAIERRGICRRELTLHVGAGTFQPVKSATIGEHPMHSEFISVGLPLIEELARCDARVIAVGTTSVRTLESLYHIGCLMSQGVWNGEVPQWYAYSDTHPQLPAADALNCILRHLDGTGDSVLTASTRIIIAPGYSYRVVSGMVTNFHQPQSTLLLLVSAFMGDEWRRMYDHALSVPYRFLSYGDACLLLS